MLISCAAVAGESGEPYAELQRGVTRENSSSPRSSTLPHPLSFPGRSYSSSTRAPAGKETAFSYIRIISVPLLALLRAPEVEPWWDPPL